MNYPRCMLVSVSVGHKTMWKCINVKTFMDSVIAGIVFPIVYML